MFDGLRAWWREFKKDLEDGSWYDGKPHPYPPESKEGYKAYWKNKRLTDNPYPETERKHRYWIDGFKEAQLTDDRSGH